MSFRSPEAHLPHPAKTLTAAIAARRLITTPRPEHMAVRAAGTHADHVDTPARATLCRMEGDPEGRLATNVALDLPLGVSWLRPQPDLVVTCEPTKLEGHAAKLKGLPL